MLRAGFANADITPAPDTLSIGSYRRRKMVGVHDRLLASACVIESGESRTALVGIDAGVIMRTTADEAKAIIARDTGIPASNIIISASHTHQGGPSLSTFYAVADPEYAKLAARGVANAVAQATEQLSPAQIGSTFGRVCNIHFNRRFVMRDGRQATHPGKMHPAIVRPAGPVDDKIGVLALRDAQQKLLGLIVNFGCHPTVTEDGNEYSADYVHHLREHVNHLLGPTPVVFLLGACGDITQIDNQQSGSEKGHAWAETMGATLAAETVRTVQRMTWNESADVRVATEAASIAVRENDASSPPALGLGGGSEWEEIYARERDHVAAIRRDTPIIDCRITAMRIGELSIVCNGAELFCQPALDIQRLAPALQTWVVTLANEYVGYVPTAEAHFAGGYEPRTARSSYLAVDAAQKILEASLRALHATNH
jgi:neutral ceramidase